MYRWESYGGLGGRDQGARYFPLAWQTGGWKSSGRTHEPHGPVSNAEIFGWGHRTRQVKTGWSGCFLCIVCTLIHWVLFVSPEFYSWTGWKAAVLAEYISTPNHCLVLQKEGRKDHTITLNLSITIQVFCSHMITVRIQKCLIICKQAQLLFWRRLLCGH